MEVKRASAAHIASESFKITFISKYSRISIQDEHEDMLISEQTNSETSL